MQIFINDQSMYIFLCYDFYYNRHFFTFQASRCEIQDWLVLTKDF